MIRDRVSLPPGRAFSSSEVNRNRIMFTENRYIQSCLLSGSCLLIWFPLLGKWEQGSQRYYVKTWKNINGEEILR